jgi:hypothetical protein
MTILHTPYQHEDMFQLYFWYYGDGKRTQPTIFVLPNKASAKYFHKDLIQRIIQNIHMNNQRIVEEEEELEIKLEKIKANWRN